MRPNALKAAALLLLALPAGLAGCSTQDLRIHNADAALPPDDGSAGFLDRMASQPQVSQNDAYRGMLLLLEGQDKAQTFQQRSEDLAARGIVGRTWQHDAARPLTKGKLAYMVCQACKIRGGVMLLLTGPSQWYCLRELQYQQMMGPGNVLAEVTGMEFVAILSRADAYLRTGEVPAIMEAATGGH